MVYFVKVIMFVFAIIAYPLGSLLGSYLGKKIFTSIYMISNFFLKLKIIINFYKEILLL